jgi:hypothetical protein
MNDPLKNFKNNFYFSFKIKKFYFYKIPKKLKYY